ncbi:MAG: potassium-transporting ATPase subunit KdpA [Armatimonadetes bacterium]|nr:potassium-transporting ATPase subunit KdpA [Armatimonadota bacterium]MDE2207244.1 potassium-transporting ATPase subunit KdpA [Armatimonadota bacterium]
MTVNAVFQIVLFLAVVLLCARPMGSYMARACSGERTLLSPLLGRFEQVVYRACGVDPNHDMVWHEYAFALLAFSAVGMILTYVMLRLQGLLPFNPQRLGAAQMPPDLAFNTAASFTTNTNWQAYVPETSVSQFSNMAGLAVHNWTSAASGVAVALALIRGICRRRAQTANGVPETSAPGSSTASAAGGIGNFWADIVRVSIYVLLPTCAVYAFVLVWQGVPQNLSPYTQATTLQGARQVIAQGPVASQEAIKMLGTNGGGFFNANSSHPYENPTPLTNALQLVSIFLIPAGLPLTFGKMAGSLRQGWAILAAMSVLFLIGAFACCAAEQSGNPNLAKLGVMTRASGAQPGGNMEGKETRFGITGSALFAVVTTDASCGAVNAMHDSFTPLGGLVLLANILSGEVIFGGVGAGLYGMLMFAILAVFIGGLMVGRTPEYIGKKIEQFEVKMAMLAVLVPAASILGFTAISANLKLPAASGRAPASWNRADGGGARLGATWNNAANAGPHGFTEILYAYASATGNNGSAFAGLTANTPWYNGTIALAALIGRFLMIIPLLAIAGSLARKTRVPATAGTFPTDSLTFVALLVGVVVLVGALTFFPAVALGPIVEHLQMTGGRLW